MGLTVPLIFYDIGQFHLKKKQRILHTVVGTSVCLCPCWLCSKGSFIVAITVIVQFTSAYDQYGSVKIFEAKYVFVCATCSHIAKKNYYLKDL